MILALLRFIGSSNVPYDAQDREKLFELADKALFLAKNRGRNQVCSVSTDLMPHSVTGCIKRYA